MEEKKGVVKHVLLAKFKDEVSAEHVEELIKGYANLVSIIEPMKAFHWLVVLFTLSFIFFIYLF